MSVIFHIPGPLREFTSGQSQVDIGDSPATLGQALSILWTMYPGVRDRIATEQEQIREHIHIFVGNEHMRYTGGLATRVPPDSTISIVAAVSGGSRSVSRARSRAQPDGRLRR
ncbi:MAG: MoaD/ThiS family protein [Acidobacteriaceae bacterium]|nr:MoaD/ThiS family protein [Acidobacteriaceae bacterium]MBV9294060.1 MoaD/ThiS family protein [Acidobacteriaceae bacterium]MBV9763817.1 MoaD/ThiS family protein [Acidobacteriaceae bacterium]